MIRVLPSGYRVLSKPVEQTSTILDAKTDIYIGCHQMETGSRKHVFEILDRLSRLTALPPDQSNRGCCLLFAAGIKVSRNSSHEFCQPRIFSISKLRRIVSPWSKKVEGTYKEILSRSARIRPSGVRSTDLFEKNYRVLISATPSLFARRCPHFLQKESGLSITSAMLKPVRLFLSPTSIHFSILVG